MVSPSDIATPKVLVVQNGARHGYGLPKAFADAAMLEGLYTDMCAGRGIGRLHSLPLPGSLGKALQRLASRVPPPNVIQRTRTTDFATLPFELANLLSNSVDARRRKAQHFHARQSDIMSGWGYGDASHIVHQFGHGGEFIRNASNNGLRVLTDMIIAPSTGRIEQEEASAFPDWGARPATIPGLIDDDDKSLFDAASIYVCPSRYVAEDIETNFGVPKSKIQVIPYGIKESWMDVQNDPTPGRVLFVGSAERRKGIHYLAKASQLIPSTSDVKINVAGGVEQAVLEHPEASKLHFLGRVPRDLIASEFQKADTFVLPSLAEGSATVIYEAMAVGLPVITTHSSGSYVEHEVTGLIVPERDPQAIADAVLRLRDDRDLRDRLAKNAKIKANEFTWAAFSRHWVEMVRRDAVTSAARADSITRAEP